MLRRNAVRKACFETLEGRALMSATIAGSVMRDLTGNGLTADDTPMGGAAVKLYKDLNGNGILDASDGAAINESSRSDLRIRNLRGVDGLRRLGSAPHFFGERQCVGIAVADGQQPEVIFGCPQQAIVRKPHGIASRRHHAAQQHTQRSTLVALRPARRPWTIDIATAGSAPVCHS